MRKTRSPTAAQGANFADRRTRIERQINRIRALQHIHCPVALQVLATTILTVDAHGEPLSSPEAEDIILMFPSELSPSHRSPALASHELRYRDAQCASSLHALRHALLVKRRLYTFKNINSRKQMNTTRSRSLLDNQQRKIDIEATSYRRAWFAKVALVGEEAAGWRKLEPQDIRMMGDEEEEKKKKYRAMKSQRKEAAKINEDGGIQGVPGAGSSTQLISWIWMASDSQGKSTDDALFDGKKDYFSKCFCFSKDF